MTWSELLRKFGKHCRGYGDVADMANQTQLLGVLLSGKDADDDTNDWEFLTGVVAEDEGDNEDRKKLYPLELGNDCLLREERREDAKAAFRALKTLNSTNSDVFTFSYFSQSAFNLITPFYLFFSL